MIGFLQSLLPLIKPYRRRMALGVLMGILAGLMEPLLMVTVQLAIDAIFPTSGEAGTALTLPQWAPEWTRHLGADLAAGARGSQGHPGMVVLVIMAIPGVMFLRGLLGYLNVYFLQWVASRAVTDLRIRLFDHLFSLSVGFFNRTSTGELMSRVLNDVSALQSAISSTISTLVKDPVTLVSLLAFLLWQNPKLTLVSLVVIPVCVVPIVIYARKVRKTAALIQMQFADISTIMHEAFTAARVVKAYNLEQKVSADFAQTAGNYVGQYMRLVRSMEIPGPLIEFFGAVGVGLFLLYVALVADVKATPGGLLQLVGSVFLMYRPIKSLTRLHSQLEQARAASARVFQLLELRSDIVEPARTRPLQAAGADITFDGVVFSYGEKQVLPDFRLTVKAGKLVALVGSSGSGKTTVTNLLLRFYDPQQGAVRIGGTDIREIHSRDLRGQIAVVTQETILFNDTIRNNIALGRAGATEAEIVAAAQHAHAHEFICDKPQGYDTVIGEKGVALSGGQRQRLAIARAILKDAPILVLDEATSALDTESERHVQAALEDLMEGRTTICIAHRLSTIQKADLIVVMEQGRIVETGTHAELLAHGRVYRKLHDLQFNV